MKAIMLKKLTFIILPVLLLSACEKEIEVTEEKSIRAVKTLIITEASKSNSRQISGVVKTSDESSLSFRISGRISKIEVKAGDSVSKGDVLARLERKDYILAVDSARADLASSRAVLAEKKGELRRNLELVKKNFVAQSAVDSAQAVYDSAKSSVDVVNISLKEAQNDLANTILRAPFSGEIAERATEPFVEIAAGEMVFILQSVGAYKVEVLIPETLIRDVSFGDVVAVHFPTFKNTVIGGTISEIAARAEIGNAFPVSIELAESLNGLRAGMTAQITLNFGETSNTPVYIVPVSALDLRVSNNDAANPKREAKVYIFNPEREVVEQRMIGIRDIRKNNFEVVSGLNAGDILIVAGVPFLTEGQKVKLWQPTYNIPAKINPR